MKRIAETDSPGPGVSVSPLEPLEIVGYSMKNVIFQFSSLQKMKILENTRKTNSKTVFFLGIFRPEELGSRQAPRGACRSLKKEEDGTKNSGLGQKFKRAAPKLLGEIPRDF